jgi:murein DD-endopeptidase MepM/ murein hydrolase activator NlpD
MFISINIAYFAYLNSFHKNGDSKIMGGPNLSKIDLNTDFNPNLNKDKAILENNTLNSENEFIYFDKNLLAKGSISGNNFLEVNKSVLGISKSSEQNNNLDFILPTTGINWGKLHPKNAVDIAASCGTPVYASESGLVVNLAKNGWNSGYGKYIEIEHLGGIKTLYAHLSAINVSIGDYLTKGEKIGEIGETGESTGCHLHFEVKGAKNPFAQ